MLEQAAAELMKPKATIIAASERNETRRTRPPWKPDWGRIHRKDAERPLIPADCQTHEVIRAVIMSGCAGYAVRPPWTMVVEGLAATDPDDEQRRALKTFLIEACEETIECGWQQGEFSLTQIVHKVLMFQTTGESRTTACVESWGSR